MIGREKEKKVLLGAFSSDYSEFVAVYGRRRVGKTFLSECICNELLKSDMTINFHTAFSLNNIFYK